jgi:hypothetical protein
LPTRYVERLQPSAIADLVVFLVSPASDMITGQIIAQLARGASLTVSVETLWSTAIINQLTIEEGKPPRRASQLRKDAATKPAGSIPSRR